MPSRSEPPRTRISDDGLRYSAKKPGSDFSAAPFANSFTTMSCFRCGRHRPLSELVVKKILGRSQKVCAVNCTAKA